VVIDGVDIEKIRQGEKAACVAATPGPAVVRWNGDPLCAHCFGERLQHGEHGAAVLGALVAASISAVTEY